RGRRLRTGLRQGDRHRDDRHRHAGDHPVHPAAAENRAMAVATRSIQRTRWIKLQLFRYVVFALAAIFFLVPLSAMVEFSTRANNGSRTLDYWKAIPSYPDLTGAIVASLQLAVITSVVMLVLLVPTMVWVRLKLPR